MTTAFSATASSVSLRAASVFRKNVTPLARQFRQCRLERRALLVGCILQKEVDAAAVGDEDHARRRVIAQVVLDVAQRCPYLVRFVHVVNGLDRFSRRGGRRRSLQWRWSKGQGRKGSTGE